MTESFEVIMKWKEVERIWLPGDVSDREGKDPAPLIVSGHFVAFRKCGILRLEAGLLQK